MRSVNRLQLGRFCNPPTVLSAHETLTSNSSISYKPTTGNSHVIHLEREWRSVRGAGASIRYVGRDGLKDVGRAVVRLQGDRIVPLWS
jgi:hypothetical protein